MTIIWWTLYVLGALTLFCLWVQAMAFLGAYLKARRDRMSDAYSGMSRKDIESLIRMEVAAHLNKVELSRTVYPGLGIDTTKIRMKEDK